MRGESVIFVTALNVAILFGAAGYGLVDPHFDGSRAAVEGRLIALLLLAGFGTATAIASLMLALRCRREISGAQQSWLLAVNVLALLGCLCLGGICFLWWCLRDIPIGFG